MDIEITLKNYRCFPESQPVRMVLRKGFTSFVGVNNSGKSSLLKFFYEFRNLFQVLSDVRPQFAQALSGLPQTFAFPPSIFDPQQDVFFNANEHDLLIEVRPVLTPQEKYDNISLIPNVMALTIPRGTNTYLARLEFTNGPLIIPTGGAGFPGDSTILTTFGQAVADMAAFLDAFRALADTLYIGAFRNALNVGTKQAYFDIHVGQAFIQTWGSYKTGAVKKYNEAAHKVEADIKRIFGFEELQINPAPDDETLQVLVDGRSYNLLELGSGLTQFILVLANAAIKQRRFILIDEPELNLHPSLQLDFITTLASYSFEGVLFATHSVGLARAVADWRYSVRRFPDNTSRVAELDSTPRLSEFLGELGFSGYRELGFGKILLVEGKTDVKTMQQFLRHYGKDHTVVPLPLGGHTMINASAETELAEITRLADEIFAVIDSERTAANASLELGREQFKVTCEKLGIRCHILERRAIENYFSPSSVLKVRGEKWPTLQPYQAVYDAWPGWSKSENWRIAREMTREDLDATDLGKFLGAI
ncbi:MAG TPA: AAA family ATPase [Bryobacteraceae bacterium]|jgi:predicted ATPase|nr:AAA family ATPase [Bryobacteraceae bacterium]